MRSSKSRSRNKNRSRNPQGGGNVINRTFDSSGPEGKVRGTPAQVIEKYNQLARDAQLSGDRVAVENFQQHAEHYTRLLAAAQKELEARQQNNQQNNQQNSSNQPNNNQQNSNQTGGQQNGNQNGQQNNNNNQNNQNPNQQGGGQDNSGQGGNQGGNRRRDNRNDTRNDQGNDQGGDARQPVEASQPDTPTRSSKRAQTVDVIDAPEVDNGPVETPENRADAPPADKPKRTRVRKKAPAKVEDTSSEPAADS